MSFKVTLYPFRSHLEERKKSESNLNIDSFAGFVFKNRCGIGVPLRDGSTNIDKLFIDSFHFRCTESRSRMCDPYNTKSYFRGFNSHHSDWQWTAKREKFYM